MKKYLFILTLAVFMSSQATFADHQAADNQADKFSTTLEWDALFESILWWNWERALSDRSSISASYLVATTYATMALFVDWSYSISSFTIGAGLGTSFGRGSFGFQKDLYPQRYNFFLAREIVTSLSASYSHDLFEIRAAGSLWIPTQESHDTALWVMFTPIYSVLKIGDFKIGPHVEPLFLKEGSGPLKLIGVWTGGRIIKSFKHASIDLLLGYDPIELSSFLGAPKKADYVARAKVSYYF